VAARLVPGWLRGYQRDWLTRDVLAGLCIGYDGGDAVSSEYKPKFAFTGGTIVKVVFDVAEDAYVDVERELEAAIAHD
jgi:hypothetical protein